MKKKLILIPILILVLMVTLVVGCTGEQGLKGLKGDDGTQGIQGEQGVQGEQGLRGVQGEQGEVGLQGVMGRPSATGATGSVGATGEQGIQGATGLRGATGAGGPTGASGADGAPGSVVSPTFKVTLGVKNAGQSSATLTTAQVNAGTYSIQLQTSGAVGVPGEEARIIIIPIKPMTLGEITSIAWMEYLTAGYPPHVDIKIDTDGDGATDDALVIEYAYNGMTHYVAEVPMPYGALIGAWYATFSDDSSGPSLVDDSCYAWLTTGAAGPAGFAWGAGNHWGDTLGNWKAGRTASGKWIDANTLVTAIEIEVDAWGVQSDAYVDCIAVNGILVWQ